LILRKFKATPVNSFDSDQNPDIFQPGHRAVPARLRGLTGCYLSWGQGACGKIIVRQGRRMEGLEQKFTENMLYYGCCPR
jgi:hypothetical protein